MEAGLKLEEPNEYLRDSFLEMAEEFQELGEYYTLHEQAQHDFPGYLLEMQRFKTGINLPAFCVRMTSFWLVSDGIVVGESRLRHALSSTLRLEGGHIGYAIRPSARRKGYGTLALALTLERARLIGLDRVLVTCDTDNVASARIIEKNGGLLEDHILSPFSGKLVSRYWIEIESALLEERE